MEKIQGAGFSRRTALAAAGTLGALGLGLSAGAPAFAKTGPKAQKPVLAFRPDGGFKVVQFNDTQDDERTDRRTIELMDGVLDAEKPDFVVINGDVINGGCDTELEVKQALNHVVRPMESRQIPWAVTFGNHDEDSAQRTGMTEDRMLEFLQSYEFNLNADSVPGLTGTSNTRLLLQSSRSKDPVFALWLIDTGRYAPDAINGQDFAGYPDWDWVRMDQVTWYRNLSIATEQKYGKKVPSLMWGHIALHEHRNMWFASIDSRTDADHARAVAKHNIVGERNEDECPGPFNSGLFNAFLERGDVLGYFVGHDHVNTYVGNYYGVQLGYAPGTGFGAYGLSGAERNRLRGARVFELNEDHPGIYKDTRLVFAKALGIDLTANDQPIEPLPLTPPQG
ncbi:metallophosphoesterase family protein [Pseudarthrobacter sp. J75]|uniref:metallophosphoesterase family protein n=1 Tax=unclassified Pseudarthrobacter TaxID=2647000 RepID=UPI002E80DB54|nr:MULTISPECIES: metallophosphoesterase family protein [unclassified Pseudarthrobacter]MEE2523574.1 metallophosphoesterase family protein [Pseudarthrobacter sp. J47]MEE2530556.1 metallophosphoesterase family protein [Pseudarthrobacter sp. J75]